MSQFVEMFGNTPMSYEMQDCFSLIRNGANIKQGQFEGGIPITRIETISDEIVDRQKMGYAGIADNKYELYYLQDGDILISHINSLKHIGKCALYNKKENESIIHGMNLLCLRPNIVTINPVFAIHMLRSNIIRKGITDITKPAVNQASFSAKDFGKLRTIIPPMDKQMLFVSIAEQADKSKFGDFKSQFIEMFGNCKSQGTLSSLCATFIDGDWIESKDQSDNGIRLIQTGNVGFGFFKGREDKSRYITEETFKKLNCTEVVPGDILISRLPDPIGRACIVPEGIGKAITAVDCTIVRLNATLLPEFLISFSKTALYASQINKIKTGTTRLRVSRGNLGNVIIPIPPIESQHHFAAIAQQADKSKSVIQKALVYLNDIQSDELGKIA
ncbi:restriction endonuclease subunit S [Bacteroides thetaiotaomicron]|jgi:restriction endonuclease S subunit|uniref:restriction endonuclease subunit S n=1 Tax=Bacteroides thetaiotaomicron TaxID=818 RepID=UPI0022E30D47|nr:restriction endonuclease subunit S [Bacteroides thetaiotaomicron]